MSQVEQLHELFLSHGNRLTLGEILENWRLVGSKYTGRISDLRDKLKEQGETIICHQNHETPTKTVYEIVHLGGGPQEPIPAPVFDQGQAVMPFLAPSLGDR